MNLNRKEAQEAYVYRTSDGRYALQQWSETRQCYFTAHASWKSKSYAMKVAKQLGLRVLYWDEAAEK